MKVEEYRHQVGGHCKLIKPKDSSKVYKPLIENEYIFYKKLTNFGASSAESGPLHILKKFIPKFYGVTEIVVEYSSSSEVEDNLVNKQKGRNEPTGNKGRKYFSLDGRNEADQPSNQLKNELPNQLPNQSLAEAPQGEPGIGERDAQSDKCAKGKKRKKCIPHIVLEDLVYGFKRPCVLDIKMGKRQRKIGASLEKRKRQVEKSFRTTSHSLGFRLCGCQHYNKINDKLFYKDKYWGRNLTKENIPWAIRNWFWNGILLYDELIPLLLEKLHRFFNCIVELRHYRFWSSSLLWVFDGGLNDKKARSNSLDIRMIDFANTIYLQDNPSVDDEYIFGLKNLIHSMQILNNTIQGMHFLPQEISTCFYSENCKPRGNSFRPIFKKSKSAILEENFKKKKKKNLYINFEFLKNAKARRKSSNVYSRPMPGGLSTQLEIGSPKGTSDDGLAFQYLNKFMGKKKKKKNWNQAQYFSNSDCPIADHMCLSPCSSPVGRLHNGEICFSGWLDEGLPGNVPHRSRETPHLNIPLLPLTSVDHTDDGPTSGKHSDGSDLQEKANMTTFSESANGLVGNDILELEAPQMGDSLRSDHHTEVPSRGKEPVSPINSNGNPKWAHPAGEDDLVDVPKKTTFTAKQSETEEQMPTNNPIDETKIEGYDAGHIDCDHAIPTKHATDGRNRQTGESTTEKEEVQANSSLKSKNKNCYPVNTSEEDATNGVTQKGEIPQSEDFQKCMNKSGEKQTIDDKLSHSNAPLLQTCDNVSSISGEGNSFGKGNPEERNENNSYEQVIQEVIVKTLKVASRGSEREKSASAGIANKDTVNRSSANRMEDEGKDDGCPDEGDSERHENASAIFCESGGKGRPYKHEYILSNEADGNEAAQNGDERSDRKGSYPKGSDAEESGAEKSDAEVEENRAGKNNKQGDRKDTKQNLGERGSHTEQHTQGGLNHDMLKKGEHPIGSEQRPKLTNDSLMRETKWNLLSRNINLKVFINHMIKKEIEEKKKAQEYLYILVKGRNEVDLRAVRREHFSDSNREAAGIPRKAQRGPRAGGGRRTIGTSRIGGASRTGGGAGRGKNHASDPPVHNPRLSEKSLSCSYSYSYSHGHRYIRSYPRSYSSDSGLIYNRSLQGGDPKKMLKKEAGITSKRCSSCTDIPLRIKKGKTKKKKKKNIKKKLFKKINILSGMKNNIIKSSPKIIFSNYTVHNHHCVTPPIEYSPKSDSICRITDAFNVFTPEYRSNRYVHSIISQRHSAHQVEDLPNTHIDRAINNQRDYNPFREKNLIVPLTDTNSSEKYLRRSLSEPNFYKFGYFRCILNDFYGTKINYSSLVANRLDKLSRVPIYNQIYGFTSNSSDLDSSDASWGY
ncbi:inositol polyphosphate kinase, putative [Plasmodium vivax]|uniref:Kinase n=2 Tax=Plasmodium vivax TaxID=5855 RepID=A0A1G4HK64_PLAVI|nr:hypothetical protein PVNG_00165 [Plasmodium vivax North Korean]CAG9471975.1 unnamed protein product [Plasmodium vivax]SCO69748.1 inositol polyphosphate kinase, putative [Plasmodium vivax]SCO75238.1 inositol polyphosphate kinase, putative [Plasmodium vivax]